MNVIVGFVVAHGGEMIRYRRVTLMLGGLNNRLSQSVTSHVLSGSRSPLGGGRMSAMASLFRSASEEFCEELENMQRMGNALLYALWQIPWLFRLACVDPADQMPRTEI